jgi:lupus La protein
MAEVEAAPKPDIKADEPVETTTAPSESGTKSAGNGENKPRDPDFSKYRKSGNKDGSQRPNKFREYKNNRHNIKTDYNALPETDDPDEIRKQVEFYFSDSNLTYDDHMRKLVGGTENNRVAIKEIHMFKRMRRFQPFSAVVAALKDSTVLDVVGDKEDEIRRKVPYKDPAEEQGELIDPSIPRSIYAKGFGEESSTTQFDIEKFFAPYGPVSGVRLRRAFPSREFKGSVFVEFDSQELQQEFLERVKDKPLKWEGKDLLVKSKQDYCQEKLDLIKDGKLKATSRVPYK